MRCVKIWDGGHENIEVWGLHRSGWSMISNCKGYETYHWVNTLVQAGCTEYTEQEQEFDPRAGSGGPHDL